MFEDALSTFRRIWQFTAFNAKELICSLHSSRPNSPPVDMFSETAQPYDDASVLRVIDGFPLTIWFTLFSRKRFFCQSYLLIKFPIEILMQIF